MRISRIHWCIHPYCWSMYERPPEGRGADLWNAVLEWERRIHRLHMDFVSCMKRHQASIIYPIGGSEPMKSLIAHSQKTLGGRCLIPNWSAVEPTFLENVGDPIRSFLEDCELEGREEFIRNSLTDSGRREEPLGMRQSIEAEIREACQVIGYDWNPRALKVVYHSRVLAHEIKGELRHRALVYDPETVACVAFGEGLEECAMTWKAMLPHYMGLANPIENDPTLSVSGAAYLVNAEFKERVIFADAVRLLLWEGEGGRAIGLFYRAAHQLKNPQLYAHVPLAGLDLEVWVMNDRVWPAEVHAGPPPGRLDVPVYTATRTGVLNTPHYLIVRGIDSQEFRDRLSSVTVSPDADSNCLP